jgi:alanine racemase
LGPQRHPAWQWQQRTTLFIRLRLSNLESVEATPHNRLSFQSPLCKARAMLSAGRTPTDLAGAILSIDLTTLQANYRTLAAKAGVAECGAAVKGNAYGLGIDPVARALWNAGCRTFFVARPKEGEELRNLLPQAVIYVLDGLFPGQAEFYARHDLRPALISVEEVREWATFGRQYGRALPCALHVDTGINRLGLTMEGYRNCIEDSFLMAGLNPTLLMSHLACADEPDHPLNETQRKRFAEVRRLLPDVPASLANSSGIYLGKAYTHDLVRPGIALYGGNPVPSKRNPVRAVVQLEGSVLQIRQVRKGETVGYSATWKAPRDSVIAILGLGYKDGVPRLLSSRRKDGPAQVWMGGKRCPVVGRVSMDMMAIDVTAVSAARLHKGMLAEVFGGNIAIDEAAAWAGTISYELLTRLGSRYARVYSGLSPGQES